MRRLGCPVFLFCVMATFILSGCEWQGTGSGDTWDSSVDWVNFSGVYKPGSGASFLVSGFAPAEGTPSTLESEGEALGTGNGIDSTFSGTLSHVPMSLGSVSVTDGTETFIDGDGSGKLVGNKGGVGSINYQTGAITVTFKLAPALGNSIIVTYMAAVEGTPANPVSGSSSDIFTLSVDQQGNMLSFTDSNGAQYSGTITGVTTPTGGGAGTNIMVSTTIIANFEASGTQINGEAITITGAFYGDYTVGTKLGTGGTLENRIIQGTWIEASGQTGNLYGSAGGTATITDSSTNNPTFSPFWWWY
jgi:hypothetical protein